ncbi:phage replisome organizer protein [Lactococcus lactis]|uniref:phage replisome organizer protein n=1 Tax=Lactococcus lactis TaxID=1358 RepID=UPI00071C4666|nr:phage replisome organiser protein [Lactococcus lactis]KST87623.1 DNA replication protein phage-associated [Lactococcus lactis subsp. lactis]
MARPTKQGIDYYPKDVKAKYDTKFKYVESKNSVIARLVIYELWDLIYAENGYFLKFDNIQRVLFLGDLPINDEQLTDILDSCFEIGLFEKSLFDKYQILTSESIQKRYMEAVGRRAKVPIISSYFLLPKNSYRNINLVNDYINSINDDNNSINDYINPQSKVKESKVNKNKVKENREKENKTNNQEIFSRFFELFSNFNKKNISKRAMALQVFLDLPQFQKDCIVKGAENYIQDYINNHSDDSDGNYSVNPYEFLDNVMFMNYQEEVKADTGYDEDLGF